MSNAQRPVLIFLFVTALMAVTLFLMGRDPICPCGYVSLWTGPDAAPREGSQHLFDLYSPSHLIHGLIFYGVLALVARRLSVNLRLGIALVVEAGWEILENTPMVIERYRAVTVSLDYNGDSIINSVFDVIAMVVGFYLARWIPIWASVLVALGFEALTIALIRDGLALNILMLFWPTEAVLQWQQGG